MSAPEFRDAHERLSALLSEHVDGELPEAVREEVRRHLEACAACRDTLEGLHAVVVAARTWPDQPPSRDLWPAIAARTIETAPSSSAPSVGAPPDRAAARRVPTRRTLVPLRAAAAVLVIAVASTWWLSRPAPESHAMPRYLLLLHVSPGDGQAATPDERRAHIARYAAWSRAHAVLGEKLADFGGLMLAAGDAQPLAAGADVIGGLFIIEAADEAAARAVAATCPHLEHGGRIELRPIEDT